MRTDYNLFSQYIIDKNSEGKEVIMFPTEIELEMHRQEMRRAAENYHLIKSLREEDAEPTFWQRLRTRLSSAQPTAPVIEIRGSVKQQQPTEAIA